MENKVDIGTRLGSMIMDHFIMTMIAMIFVIPGMISMFASAFQVNHQQPDLDLFGPFNYVSLVGFALYLCKDSIHGRSIAKRVLKLQIIDIKTGLPASPLKCLSRNLFCIIWPIEVILTLANPSQRLGDRIAGTKVVPYEPPVQQPELNYGQIIISLAIAYGIMVLFMLPFEGLRTLMKNQQVSYIEASINEAAAEEIVKLFESELGDELDADVKVYDQIQNAPDLKYISVILCLDRDYLDDDDDYEEIKEETLPILLSTHPKGTFVGQIKYVYKRPTRMITRTLPLDWRNDE